MILKGFTLVELLIVIAILSILSTIGVANFRSARLKAMDAQRKSDLQTIAKSLEAYVNDYRSYPATGVLVWGQPLADPAHPETIYSAKLPTDPGSYDYVYVSGGTSYTLYAYLENENDPARIETGITETCKTNVLCNYKLTSSNIQ